MAIVRARELHPEGTDLADVMSEVAELARAVESETPERVRAEAIDVAVTAMRVAMGEARVRR